MIRLFIGLFLLFAQISFADDSESNHISALVKTKEIKSGNMTTSLRLYGKIIAPNNEVKSINFTRDININKIFLNQGKVAKAGEEIMEITTAISNLEDFKQLKTNLEFAEKELKRIELMFKQKMATLAELNSAKKVVEDANHNLKAQETLGSNIDNEIIRLPYDAIITEILSNPGEQVKAGTTVVKLLPLNKLLAKFSVNPNDINKINIDDIIEITSVINNEYKVKGKIQEIDTVIDPSTNLIDIRANLEDNHNLIIGMNVIGEIKIIYNNQLIVPKNSITLHEGKNYIYIYEDGRAKGVPVKIIAENDKEIAIAAEVKPDQKVITEGSYQLTDGTKVRLN